MQSQPYKQQSFTLTLYSPGVFRCGDRSFVSITIQAFSANSIKAYMHAYARCTSTSCMHNRYVHKFYRLRNVNELNKYTTDLCSCFSVQMSLCVWVCAVRAIVVFAVTFIISLGYNNNNNNHLLGLSTWAIMNGSLNHTFMNVGCVVLGNEIQSFEHTASMWEEDRTSGFFHLEYVLN